MSDFEADNAMSDFEADDAWNNDDIRDDEIKIEDLAAPRSGFRLLLFALGKKLQIVHPLVKLAAFVSLVGIFAALLLPGLTSWSAWGSPASLPVASPVSHGHQDCAYVVNGVTYYWRYVSSVSADGSGATDFANCITISTTPQLHNGKP